MMTEMQYQEILEEKARPEKEFLALFEKYKKNREIVSEEELKTRYKKSYNKLRQDLANKATVFMEEYVIPRVQIPVDEQNAPYIDEIRNIMDETSRTLSKAIFKDMDLDKVYAVLKDASTQIYNVWWQNNGSKQEEVFQKVNWL